MREIKFRQPIYVDGKFKRFVYWGFIDGTFRNPVTGDSLPGTKKAERDSQQYTGLKDKNGDEIYEGDLFRCIYYPEGHKDHIYQVCYSEEATRFFLKRIGIACVQVAVMQTVLDVSRYEIIGNVHENPELLNGR